MMRSTILLSILFALLSGAATAQITGQGCNCTLFGNSGTAIVDRIGCAMHLLNQGDNFTFCYVVDPSTCQSANRSTAYPGAAYRDCDPRIDPSNATNVTISDIINGVPDLSTLSRIASSPSLSAYASQFSNETSNFTVFAPNNDAFSNALDVLGLNSTEDLLNSTNLIPLILLHVAQGNFTPEYIQNEAGVTIHPLSPSLFSNISALFVRRFTRRPGSRIRTPTNVLLLNNVVYNNETISGLAVGTYSLRSIPAKNGIVYIIENVLALRDDVSTSINQSQDLTFFSQALNVTGLSSTALGAGGCPNPQNGICNVTGVTVWAPVDAAWLSFAATLNTTPEALLKDIPLMNTLVQYHISPNTQLPGGGLNITVNQTIPTLLDKSIQYVNVTRTVPIFSSSFFGTISAEITAPVLSGNATDNFASFDVTSTIDAYNGMVVPIDAVLLPSNLSVLVPAGGGVGVPAGEVGALPAVETPVGEGQVGGAAPSNY